MRGAVLREGVEMPIEILGMLNAMPLFPIAARRVLLQMLSRDDSSRALGIWQPSTTSHS